MGNRDDPRFWVDILKRKHECGPYLPDPIRVEVVHEGRTLAVWMPEALPDWDRFQILATAESEGRLFLLASHTLSDPNDEGCGIIMVARKDESGEYIVHVWHELYPYALKYLGLSGPRS